MVTQLSLLAFPQRARVSHAPDLPVIVDLFAGGGGASEGIRRATGTHPIVAINHDPAAIAMHAANHPSTLHLCESVYDVRPGDVIRGRAIDLLWASPDCTHFSRAKGGKPRKKEIRGLAWVVVDWAREVRPRIICLENVPEFVTWGPLHPEDHPDPKLRGQPDPAHAGETFREWTAALRDLGYAVEWRVLVAADYGAPTTRRRLFLVARADGAPIAWPEPTHGPGRAQPYRTAAECIDWSIPCPSIFTRKRPLAEATQRRIAEGVRRYVLEAARPFIVPVKSWGGGGNGPRSIDEPMRTVTTSKRGEFAVVAPSLINTRNGERQGQAPRTHDITRPFPTVTATGSQGALVAAFLAKHNGSGDRWAAAVGQDLAEPMHTVTGRDTKAAVTAHLAPEPGDQSEAVAAFLVKYYGSGGQWQALTEPLHTIVAKARFGLVTVPIAGEEYALVDIGMRMLVPRELARAQGFGDDYHLTGTVEEQTGRIGNSVCPDVAAALVGANLPMRRAA
jgi:DNA (cytosine-5)-methyltransferase 1